MDATSVAIIPARGGSVGVPGKNLRRVGGRSLVARAVQAAADAGVDLVVVSTDAEEIAQAALSAGADVIWRPAKLSTDTASSEAALVHALGVLEAADASAWQRADGAKVHPFIPGVVVFMQATSPFIRPSDIAAAVEEVAAQRSDSVFSAKESHTFQWRQEAAGIVPVGHEMSHRLMRQQLPPQFQETGAFYVMNRDGFLEAGSRFFGRINVQLVPDITAFEIDSQSDLDICNALAPLVERTAGLSIDADAVVTDFDGVHTDDSVMVGETGTEHVFVNRRDGLGVARLVAARIPFLILSTERNPVVTARAAKLGVPAVQGVDDKATALDGWLHNQGIDPARTAYLGNDENDLPAMALVGWPCATADAVPAVRAAARVVLDANGGHGAVRELCDRVLRAKTPDTEI